MFTQIHERARASYPAFRLAGQIVPLILLTLSLLAAPVAAQSDQAAKRAAAEKLAKEGGKLLSEGSKESLQQALQKFAEAQQLFRSLNDSLREGVIHFVTGEAYRKLNEPRKALDSYNQALPLFRAAGNRSGEALMLSSVGLLYSRLGEKQKALDCFNQALTIRRAIGERHGEAKILGNIGGVYADLGESRKALDYYNQALPIVTDIGDRENRATLLNNLGLAYSNLGENQKALDHYNQALALYRALGERGGEATTLTNIGTFYSSLGEKQKALDSFNQALPIFPAIGDQRGWAATLTNIGLAYKSLGDMPKALDYCSHALPIIRAYGDSSGEAVTLGCIGQANYSTGEHRKALDFTSQALTLKRAVGDRRGEAQTLHDLAVIYYTLGEKQKALDHFDQALPLLRAVGDRSGEAEALGITSDIARADGDLDGSLARVEASIDILESLRTKIPSQGLRASFFASKQYHYEFYIDLLMSLHVLRPAAGYDGRALQARERARARSLLELLAEAGADIRQGVDAELLKRERDLQGKLNAAALRQVQLLGDSRAAEQADAVANQIAVLTTDLQLIEAQIKQASPRYADLAQPRPLTLREIQTQVLDADTLLLEYSLGKKRSFLWAVTPTSITSHELPKRVEIEEAAGRFYKLITTRPQSAAGKQGIGNVLQQQADSQLAQAATHLSRMLLAPVAPLLGKKRLLVVGDGALQYIPFAALPAPAAGAGRAAATPLVVEHEIVNLPSASTLAVLRRETGVRSPAPKTLAVLADPVFESGDARLQGRAGRSAARDGGQSVREDESRAARLALATAMRQSGVGNAELSIPRLLGTRSEAEAIVKLVPHSMRREMLDFAANRAAATDPELSQYRYVHFATHGLLNNQRPELSGLVLSLFDERGASQDGFLRAHEVFNLKLAADMVVLSACQTGLGTEIKGEGLVGLTRGFMYAGAPRVVVSLWNVNDAATAELMTRFYHTMLVDKLRPAQALQAAQVSMLKEKRYSAPFYWAAFTLQGEWR